MTAAAPQPPLDPIARAAREIQACHRVGPAPAGPVAAWAALEAVARWLPRVRSACASADAEQAKAAEWLLDNHYQLRRTVRQIRTDLPKSFFRRLPSLTEPSHRTMPRAYCVAHAMLDATHFQVSLALSVQYVSAYEEGAPLTIAELWAFPTMLRLACLETVIAASGELFTDLEPPFAPAPRGASSHLDPTDRLARALSTLHAISAIPWRDFFDRTSLVEAILRTDPARVYALMDFDTRDRYRTTLESLAQWSGRDEAETARLVVAKARDAAADARRGHVGYWLIDQGRPAIERELGCRGPFAARMRSTILRHPGAFYAGAMALTWLAGLSIPLLYLEQMRASLALLVTGLVLNVLPASILATTLVHWSITHLLPPRILPKLDFEEGIASDCATAVVVPVIVGSVDEVPALLETIELHWMSNPDPMLRFALLTDHTDAPEQALPGDAAITEALVAGVRRLNRKAAAEGGAPFHLLHRERRHNPAEDCWMAWERKRGKLEQFNALLLGTDDGAFALHEGDAAALRGIRFVVTVDADTMLAQGSVARLVGILAHPLNSPVIDEASGRLQAGFTVVQPRVEIAPDHRVHTVFSRLYTGDTAIDIYSRAVSDVYQDLFGSAVFVGKGIYDVAAFERCLRSKVPDNTLLSHDLFEGAHGRVALASDVVVYDGFPSSYVEFCRRAHRWVRGDWQLVPWLARRVPAAKGGSIANTISRLDRWRIADNLRRSVLPIGLVAFGATAWLALPGDAWVWTLLTIAAPGAYVVTDLVSGIANGYRRGTARGMVRQIRDHAGRWLLAIAFLAHDAAIALDAIVRTLWRVFVSRRRLLRWTSAAHAAAGFAAHHPRGLAWRTMWPASAAAVAYALLMAFVNPHALAAAAPLLVLWALAPELALAIGRPLSAKAEQLGAKDRAYLRRVARRTWLFFETFVGPSDNWLPPDNYQEDPDPEIAHRTSPTNIGMLLVSSLSAWDFGYLGSLDLAARLTYHLDTIERLERYRGHVLNWYDTRTLVPLEPRYVSTVDSGNLAVALITLGEGCIEIADAPPLPVQQWDGLIDTLDLLERALRRFAKGESEGLAGIQSRIRQLAQECRDHPAEWSRAIRTISTSLWPELETAIVQIVTNPQSHNARDLRDTHTWVERFDHHLAGMRHAQSELLPWLEVLESAPADLDELKPRLWELLEPSLSLATARVRGDAARALVAARREAASNKDASVEWLGNVGRAIERGANAQAALRERIVAELPRIEALALGMDFTLLYDSETWLFHIGYNLSSDRIDPHHYDLLATEARLASYFAIAKRDVPAQHWRHLGRPIGRAARAFLLLSWNGSMFEYLMPTLLLRSGDGKLLAESERTAVLVQRRYAEERGVPWGISESAFAQRDAEHNYQYRAFGVPGLGLRRGLAEDLVIAPYASALALAVFPVSAAQNLRRIEALGLTTRYGFVEAVDFTPERMSAGTDFTPVRAYMAHHQGMIFAALGNALHGNALARRFARNRRMSAVDLLLHERVPWEVVPEGTPEVEPAVAVQSAPAPAANAWQPPPVNAFPAFHLLGNGRMASWISEAGGGTLRWHRQALTRWAPDSTRDHQGLWIYVRDTNSDMLWSVGRQPTGVHLENDLVNFHPHMAEFHRHVAGLSIGMEVTVASSADLEIRRLTIVNDSDTERRIELTSYGEVVLASPLDDERHPAFSKLFVSSEFLPGFNGLLFERRARNPGDPVSVLMHRVLAADNAAIDLDYETDRAAFLGRLGEMRRPAGVVHGLSGTVGWTLDPIMSLQLRIVLAPRARQQLAILTLAGGTRESVLELAERYATMSALDWAFADTMREVAREGHRLSLDSDDLPRIQRIASLLLGPRRPPPAIGPAANQLGQPRLWSLGLSGDLPIIVLRMSDPRDADFARLLMCAQQLWRKRLLRVDLVVLRLGVTGYEEPVREMLLKLAREIGTQDAIGHAGGVHLVFADQIGAENRRALEALAHVVLDPSRGSLDQQLDAFSVIDARPPSFQPTLQPDTHRDEPLLLPEGLQFDNGIGGFSADGREYLIHLAPGKRTPAPWCNVLANDEFGTVVSESGGGFTWAVNSGENRLTPWANDPVLDTPGEAIYLRDEETAEIWSPTLSPCGGDAEFLIAHGAGYSTWTSRSHRFEIELTVFVSPDEPVKISRLRLRDLSGRARHITVTCFVEWVLGALASLARRHVACDYDAATHALLARNPWNPEFGQRVAFLAADRAPDGLTIDRRDFLGREGNYAHPAGLTGWDLGGDLSAGSDPCAALQIHLNVAAHESADLSFFLGQCASRVEATQLVEQLRSPGETDRIRGAVDAYWNAQLDAVQVQTPDPAANVLLNRWLLYQALASRIMARAGYYQAGGAIGFRDQLQDMLALLHTDPARTRAHILDCAAHQFEEGDVLHWWHRPQDRGVRTRCSDDLLWLPYVTSRYVEATGDLTILDEGVTFLNAPTLGDEEDDRYALFERGSVPSPLFEHCERALVRGVTAGEHGLPLMGAGDWNDGMNLVGRQGRGESVWLGWFAIATMRGFAELCTRRSQPQAAQRWLARSEETHRAIQQHGWDGDWYLRAIDDDGLAWGASAGEECRIDSIAQSWAVLSGVPVDERARTGVDAALRELVSDEDRLVRLLWPPFQHTVRDPGYIKAYPPGIRENGGQYSHAAAWLGLALTGLGDGDGAWRIFQLMNPVRHTDSPERVARYRVEPYVLAADVAGVDPHTGRGGWSWYTGAAAWTWRLAIEGVLGLRRRDGRLVVAPCLPTGWGGASAQLRGANGTLDVRIDDPEHLGRGAVEITVDGQRIATDSVEFPTDGSVRAVRVRITRVAAKSVPLAESAAH